MNTEPRRTCPSCGNEFSGAMEFCPVCMLRKGLAGGVESGESSASEDTVKPTTPEQAVQRFEHYELVIGEDGKPVELGRGAMGVTYKAFDVDLHCPVTLKVIGERYLGDEAARLRFLREARAAARLRHSNVASVLHLGRTGSSYFYAMEFVEGETLERLIKRSGRLDVKVALEITTQVAAGLAAVHKQKLVHRDIKPSNIMVSLQDGGAVTAKIIDLGLAKAVNEPSSQTAISMPGGFVGTPDFASPEQFAGVQVDIRSDFYSLGATLWKMVTGQTPFRGTSSELMYRHLHAPLAIEELDHMPQPVVVLLEVLLEKDPARRFQNPAELLKALTTITGAIDTQRRITPQSLQKTPSTNSRAGIRRPPTRLRAESLCYSLNRPLLLYVALMGQWRYSLMNYKLTATMQIAERVHLLAEDQKQSALMIGACRALAGTSYFSGDFGWARSTSGDTVEGIAWMENGITDYRASGATLAVPFYLALKAEALHLVGRTSEALEAIREAEAVAEISEDRHWCAELCRFRGVFLANSRGDEPQIEASFCEAIRIAKEQNSISLEKRAEATYVEYRKQKASASGGLGFRLPLC
jgi:serine/threonine protein kinase